MNNLIQDDHMKNSRLHAMQHGIKTGFGERQLNKEYEDIEKYDGKGKRHFHHQERQHEKRKLQLKADDLAHGVYPPKISTASSQQPLTAAIYENVVATQAA